MKTGLLTFLLVICAGAALGDEPSQVGRATSNETSAVAWRDIPEAQLRSEAGKGSARAMWMLAWQMQGKKRDGEFRSWIDKAVDAGYPEALTYRAATVKDTQLKVALGCLEKAVKANHAEAKVELANILVAGDVDSGGFFVKADPARAVELLQSALDQGSIGAAAPLAELYTCGIGEPRNAGERPVPLLKKACMAGNFFDVEAFVTRLQLGWGVEKDLLDAAGWMARASSFTVRETYRAGEAEDEDTLRRLCSRYHAALVEDSSADLMELAEAHEKGQGGKANLPRAIALYTLAQRSGGTAAATKRRELESRLDESGRKSLKAELEWMRSVRR